MVSPEKLTLKSAFFVFLADSFADLGFFLISLDSKKSAINIFSTGLKLWNIVFASLLVVVFKA